MPPTRPADELDDAIAEAGDDRAPIVAAGSLSCTDEALRATNGGVPLEAGRIVLIPPTSAAPVPPAGRRMTFPPQAVDQPAVPAPPALPAG